MPQLAPFRAVRSSVGPSSKKISIIFAEGDDLGPSNVILDNIRVNARVVGKPTGE